MKFRTFFFVGMILALSFYSCKRTNTPEPRIIVSSSNSTREGQTSNSGNSNVPPPKSLKARSGKTRIELSWIVEMNSGIYQTIIKWNNGNDSVIVPVSDNQDGDTLSKLINDLSEGTYDFEVINQSKEGISNRKKVTGKSYGQSYEGSLSNAVIESVRFKDNDDPVIVWSNITDNSIIGIELEYTKNSILTNLLILPTNREVILEDYKDNSLIKYRTLYKPTPISIDTFYSSYITIDNLNVLNRDYYLSFKSLQRGGTPTPNLFLKVLISEDFNGVYKANDVNNATWINVTSAFDWSPFAPEHDPYTKTIANVGQYISKTAGFYVAFLYHYIPNVSPKGRNWMIKDFKVLSPSKDDILVDGRPPASLFNFVFWGEWDQPDRTKFFGMNNDLILFRDNWGDKSVELKAWAVSEKIDLE